MQVIIGNDAAEFVKSELGKIILGMAELDAKAAVDDLALADASDIPKIRELQLKLRVAKQFDRYLGELVIRGSEAFEAYKQQKEES